MNDEEHVLPIMVRDFKGLSLGPAKLIPTYETKEIPEALKSIDVELLRNQKGGCLLIKKKAVGSQTLFPKLPVPTESYIGHPFQSIPKLSVLIKPKSRLVNEETGIHLAWGMGIIQSFLMEVFSPYEQFAFGGRLKTRVKGKFRILGQDYPVDALVEADGYFESQDRIVVLEAKQSNNNQFCADFSIHQLLLPLMLIRGITGKTSSGIFLDYSISRIDGRATVNYRIYHYNVPGSDSSIDPFSYRAGLSKQYVITI